MFTHSHPIASRIRSSRRQLLFDIENLAAFLRSLPEQDVSLEIKTAEDSIQWRIRNQSEGHIALNEISSHA